jgi:hypothetical protein
VLHKRQSGGWTTTWSQARGGAPSVRPPGERRCGVRAAAAAGLRVWLRRGSGQAAAVAGLRASGAAACRVRAADCSGRVED